MAASVLCTSCGNVTVRAGQVGPQLPRRAVLKVRLSQGVMKKGALKEMFWPKVSSSKLEVQRGAVVPRQSLAGQAVAGVKYVTGEEGKEMVEKDGYKIVDIRDQVQYERCRIPTAVHIPYFIKNEDNDIGTIINRQLHNGFSGLFYGLAYTKTNPEFVSTVTKQFPKDSKLLLVCHEGLRSGYAAEKLEAEGYQNLAYIATGLQSVKPGIFPKEGKVELQDGGKGGLVTVQGKFSIILGTILVLAYLFLQFFPEQAEELFFKT